MEMKKNNIEYQSEENRVEERKKNYIERRTSQNAEALKTNYEAVVRASQREKTEKGKNHERENPEQAQAMEQREREFVGNEIECERFPISKQAELEEVEVWGD